MSFAPLTISDLPNELLVAIAAAGQEGRVPDADSQPMISKTEWTLSHLSRRSRDVIVGAPALWTLVEANLNAEGSIEILKLYLERSRPCNIWATLRRPSVPVPDNHELIEERISKILPHVHRMWRLRIVFNTIMGGLLLAPFSDMAAPNLEHLELVNELNPWYSRWSSLGMFVRGGAPKLTFLKMNGLRLQLPLPQWVASLTHLELLRGQTPAELDSIMIHCRSLVHLHLDISWLRARRFHIPSLQTLHLSIADRKDDCHLLSMVDLFDTPALTQFIIDGTHGDQIFALFNSSLPHSSFPALTSFSFVNKSSSCSCETERPFSNSISAPPLGLLPALSSLTLINQCFTTSLVNSMLSLPWPHLNTVALCPQQDHLVDVREALHDAVELRRQRGQPFLKLRLSLPLAFPQEIGAEAEIFDPEDVLKLFRS